MPTTRWTESDVPDQHGRTAVITGGNNGLGYETALVLARHGATVVLACRDAGRAAAAAGRITAAVPGARVGTVPLDLSRQSSVRAAADRLRAAYPRLDLLINNAGLIVPAHTLTEDGFELTLATNHLGHFALTGLLLDTLLATPGSRVVTVSSIGHRRASSTPATRRRCAASGRRPRTSSPSWPTCCSRTSCSGGWRPPAPARSRWPRTPATRAPASGTTGTRWCASPPARGWPG